MSFGYAFYSLTNCGVHCVHKSQPARSVGVCISAKTQSIIFSHTQTSKPTVSGVCFCYSRYIYSHPESRTMGFLHCLLKSSSSKPHRCYKKYLHPRQAKHPLLENLRRLASRCFRGRSPTGYRQLVRSEKMIPCVVYEDLPDYEDSEHRDAAEASSQPVGVFAVRENSFTLQKTLHQWVHYIMGPPNNLNGYPTSDNALCQVVY